MKLGSVADLHWHQFKPFSKVVDGVFSRIYDTAEAVMQYNDYLRKKNIKYSLFAGDWFTSRRAIDAATREISDRVLDDIGDDLLYVGIQGNHDFYDSEGNFSSLVNLHERFVLLDEENPGVVLIDTGGGNEVMDAVFIQGIRWYEHFEDFNEARLVRSSEYGDIPFYMDGKLIEMSKEDKETYHDIPRICLIHQDIIGSVYPTGRKVHKGVNVSRLEKNFDMVLSGHIHKHQAISKKTIMIGSLIQHDFGDVDQDRGFLVVNSDNMKWKHVQVDAPKFIDVDDLIHIDKDSRDFYRVRGAVILDGDIPENVSIIRTKAPLKDSDVQIDASLSATEAMDRYVDEVAGNFDFDLDKLIKIKDELVSGALDE